MTEVHVAFLWHMHQPWYLLPEAREAVLPWVRLRAAKDYYDMAQHLRRTGFPCTVNFTPCLTEQLRLLAAGEIRDPFVPDGSREAEELVRAGHIPLPLARRGFPEAPRLGRAEDLWAWFFLAWTAQTALEEDPRAARFRAPFSATEGDVEALQSWQGELVRAVLPLYRALGDSGQIELTTTPFYHPILPLLLDTEVARRARPMDSVPAFRAPEDARAQAERALGHHAEVFGARPQGMWPAEGAVSPEALALLADLGVAWVATDGEILARTLGRPPAPEELYQPWRLRLAGQEILVVFRDTVLSNLLSFTYGAWPVEAAVEDFLSRVAAVARNWRGSAPPLVLIAMDGENAWDHYAQNGRPFLLRLYQEVQRRFRPTSVGDYLARFGPQRELPGLWSGSWIDADFRTWIGEPLQNRAWQALAEARAAVQECPDPEGRARALAHVHVAEGSDWFWWRSSRNPTPLAPHFARIFREHVAAAWRVLGRTPPEHLATL